MKKMDGVLWPTLRHLWAVTEHDEPLEAQLENATQGVYHGYPIPDTDPMGEEVLKRWNSS